MSHVDGQTAGHFQCPQIPFPQLMLQLKLHYHKLLVPGQGAVLGSSLAHGHQGSTICWEHTRFG